MHISTYDDDIRTRNLLIRTYVEKPVVLFIVAGQSNAMGSCSPAYETATYCGQFWNWKNGVNALQPLKDPTSANGNGGSAWPAFARQFFELTHRKVCILNVAKGATSVTGTGDHSWSEENGVLRSTAQTQYQACIAALGEENENYVHGGLLWIQGEADTGGVGNGTTPVITYKTKTINVFNFFRTLTGKPSLPVYLSQIGFRTSAIEEKGNIYKRYVLIQNAQVDMSHENENVYLSFSGAKNFNAAEYMYDDVHYSQHGYNIVGRAMARFISSNQNF